MSVGRRLAIAFGLHIALLAGLLAHHVITLRRTVATAHELSDVSAHLVLAASLQASRLRQLDESLAKFAVTRDRGYREKFIDVAAAFDAELEVTSALPATAVERDAVTAVAAAWREAQTSVARAASAAALAPLQADDARRALADVRGPAEALSEIARTAMRERLRESSDALNRATSLSWLAIALALLLAGGTAVMLVRSIAEPMRGLIIGTRELARGHFSHRVGLRGADEFAEVAAAFNGMADRLGTLDRMKQDFVSTVSHDLKSPLASLRESTALLLDGVAGPLTDAQRRVLQLQRESGDRLSRMIAKLLDLSRLEAGQPFERHPVDVTHLVRSVAEHVGTVARERQVSVRAHVAPDLPPLLGDDERLRVLLENLGENAVKFSPVGGEVEIRADVEGGAVTLCVADRGPGVDIADRERIFERFQQTATGRGVAARGVGLGLTICREIVRAHGGRIRVEGRQGGGSLFVAVLPAAHEVAA
jgi:signal transduction histidine kinase